MDIKTYSEEVKRTLKRLRNVDVDNVHMIFGLFTEIGELVDGFKREMAYNKEMDMVNVKEEIGDIMWYLANFCNINGFDLEEILQTNVNKLRIRYPEKFTEDLSLNRDLHRERATLSGQDLVFLTQEQIAQILYNEGFDPVYTGGGSPSTAGSPPLKEEYGN